ncbi:hypothetical protein HRH59_11345 [Rheinheimera sp. YQF-2]|uniref:Uncharacterized protein n=1 Tax=Rheinheimera lutimaris TaxID=2740584 RepID=A0A7Y5ARD1_9GAMM|nr:hypothetical protein [Rheinheimera lutimaris]NRQ43137.1 hypothetical protein [Rheinheimera lutimaris]
MKVNSSYTDPASKIISNGAAIEVNKPLNSKEQLNSELGRLAADIYHKGEHQEAEPVYNRAMTITITMVGAGLTKEAEEQEVTTISRASANLYMPSGEVSKSVEKMFSQYGKIMAEIASELPSLAGKNWGLSINQSGEPEVTGSLSDAEKALIAEKFTSNKDFVAAAKDFKSGYLKYTELSVRGWSNYDVNEENFSKVFDLKEILDNVQGNEAFKKAWGKDFSWLELNDNISAQLSRNAEKL